MGLRDNIKERGDCMKIKNLILFFLIFFLLSSCSSTVEIHEMVSLNDNEYVDIILYNSTEEVLNECKEKLSYYLKLLDRENTYEGLENVCSLNTKKMVALSEELVEGIHYAEDILAQYEVASLLAGGLNDLWDAAYEQKITPSEEAIQKELQKIKTSSLKFEKNTVSIIGDASLDLDFMKRGFILSKLKSYLISEGVSEYILNFSSRTIIYGQDPKTKYFTCSFYGIKNGYYKIEDMSMSCLGADIIVWYAEDGYRYTNIPSCVTGIPNDDYEKLFVFGSDPFLSDILAYAFFNMELEEIQKEENENEVYAMMYKELNLVYRSSYLTELMVE